MSQNILGSKLTLFFSVFQTVFCRPMLCYTEWNVKKSHTRRLSVLNSFFESTSTLCYLRKLMNENVLCKFYPKNKCGFKKICIHFAKLNDKSSVHFQGICRTFQGPALLDLQEQTHLNTSDFQWVFIICAFLFPLGNLGKTIQILTNHQILKEKIMFFQRAYGSIDVRLTYSWQ